MTITDVVFPAFLFIVGMAIPFALDSRRERGETGGTIWRHVLVRTLALVVIGVLMVNVETASPAGALSPAAWNVLMTVGVVLVWSMPPAEAGARRRHRLGQAAGAALLAVLVFVYRGTDATGLIEIRPHWWGILGLIGWAYLLAATLYLWLGDRPAALIGWTAVLYCLSLADAAGQAGVLMALRPFLNVGAVLGSHGAVVLSGTVLGVLLRRHRQRGEAPALFVWPALAYAAGLLAAGFLLHTLNDVHPAFRFNKIDATPPWCLVSSALTVGAWVLVYLAADVWGFTRWPRVVLLAGENALVAYLLAPFLWSVFTVSAAFLGGPFPYAEPIAIGLVRSAVFAWVVVRLCGLLRGAGLCMQL
jgi:heparan-alpha-glucosaminide N-acetyltransferase